MVFFGLGAVVLLVVVDQVSCQSTFGNPVQDMSNRNNHFAARLFQALAARTDENVLLSPYPLFTGLSALTAATSGPDEERLLRALGLAGLDPRAVPDLFQSLRSAMLPADPPAALKQGMAIFHAENVQMPDGVVESVPSKYGGKIQTLQYSSPHEAVDSINRWAQGQAGDQVQDVVATVDTSTQLTLATAASYQTSFSPAFNSSLTLDERFYVDKYHVVMVPMMLAAGKYFLAYDPTVQVGILQLQMADGKAMLILLPDEDVDIGSVEEEVTAEKIQSWTRRLKKTKLEVQLPRFMLQQSLFLREVLKALGITRLFPEDEGIKATLVSLDLSASAMSASSGVFHACGACLQVVSKTVLRADERSDVAPAATVFRTLPPRLTVNRPFVFIVYDQSTGGVLLIGRVVDPTQK
ncbi:LOW QUALITY PROTEIN: protein Z-dependent protease inhibitor-like [Neosynchiropus ocellatus]